MCSGATVTPMFPYPVSMHPAPVVTIEYPSGTPGGIRPRFIPAGAVVPLAGTGWHVISEGTLVPMANQAEVDQLRQRVQQLEAAVRYLASYLQASDPQTFAALSAILAGASSSGK